MTAYRAKEAPVQPVSDNESDNERRDFLKKCGKYAAITPPAVTFLLSTTMSGKAIAASSGRPGKGGGKGGGWGKGGSKGRGGGKGR
jgi:hypothetical protein